MPARLTTVLFVTVCACAEWREHTLATDLPGGYQVVIADVNGDGKPDLIALASGSPDLIWFENPTWTRHVIVSGMHQMINLAAADLDGDGIPEIALAHEFSNRAANSIGIVSLLQHQGDPRLPWSIREIDRLPTSHRLRWARVGGELTLVNAPLTNAEAKSPEDRMATPLLLYRAPEWKREVISEANEGVVHGILVMPWSHRDRDSILTAGFSGIAVHDFVHGRWIRRLITPGDPAAWPKSGSSDIAVGRLGRKRFLTAIEPWHGNQVVVYEGSRREVIDASLNDGHTIAVADLAGDGHDQIVASFRGKPQSVYVYRKQAGVWKRTVIDEGGMAAASCAVGDLNGDGRPDIACIGSATHNLKWYENLGTR